MGVNLHDTLTSAGRPLRQPGGEPIKIYQCGPTVYDSAHIGHARPAVMYDTLVRYLKYRGYDVVHVLNFTDVDDKIINRAREEERHPLELAEEYAQEYLVTMDMLGVERADHYPRVSKHIDDIIEVIQGLINKGHAYETNGDVYFDVESFEDYGKLSNRNVEELVAGARVEVGDNKRNPADFALWKSAKPGEISWESPWGEGRPGWHIECSALALRYLGETIDIHGGGTDLVFPHHENEVAQSEAYTGKTPFSQVWMHCGLLQLGGEKMSKSIGNIISAREAVERYGPETIRFFLLSSHYRKPLPYDDERLDNARRGWERYRNAIRNIDSLLSSAHSPESLPKLEELHGETLAETGKELMGHVTSVEEQFVEAMDHDLNTSAAIAALFELAGSANRHLDSARGELSSADYVLLKEAHALLTRLGGILGIYGISTDSATAGVVDQLVELLLDIRTEARENRNWKLADKIRGQLQQMGIIVEDASGGTRWFWE